MALMRRQGAHPFRGSLVGDVADGWGTSMPLNEKADLDMLRAEVPAGHEGDAGGAVAARLELRWRWPLDTATACWSAGLPRATSTPAVLVLQGGCPQGVEFRPKALGEAGGVWHHVAVACERDAEVVAVATDGDDEPHTVRNRCHA